MPTNLVLPPSQVRMDQACRVVGPENSLDPGQRIIGRMTVYQIPGSCSRNSQEEECRHSVGKILGNVVGNAQSASIRHVHRFSCDPESRVGTTRLSQDRMDETSVVSPTVDCVVPRGKPRDARSRHITSGRLKNNKNKPPATPTTKLAQKPHCQKEHIMAEQSGDKAQVWTTVRAIKSSIITLLHARS
jgi:hypothetical protein